MSPLALEHIMKMRIASIEPTVVRIAVEGEAPAPGPDEQIRGLADLLGEGWNAKRVLIDFSGVRMAGSAAIGWLLNLQRQFKIGGGTLALHSMRPEVGRAFKLLKVDSILNIFPEEHTALAALEACHV
jgi:anti-anti-sigma factor